MRDLTALVSLFMFLALSMSNGLRPFKGYVCGEYAGAIGAAKGLVSSATRLATYIGGNGCGLGYQGAYLVVSAGQGAAAVVYGYGKVVQVSVCVSLHAGADRYFVSYIVRSLVCRVVGSATKNASSVRSEPLACNFRSFRSLSLVHTMFYVLYTRIVPPILIIQAYLGVRFYEAVTTSRVVASGPRRSGLVYWFRRVLCFRFTRDGSRAHSKDIVCAYGVGVFCVQVRDLL